MQLSYTYPELAKQLGISNISKIQISETEIKIECEAVWPKTKEPKEIVVKVKNVKKPEKPKQEKNPIRVPNEPKPKPLMFENIRDAPFMRGPFDGR